MSVKRYSVDESYEKLKKSCLAAANILMEAFIESEEEDQIRDILKDMESRKVYRQSV